MSRLQKVGNFIRRASLTHGLGDRPTLEEDKTFTNYKKLDSVEGIRLTKTGRQYHAKITPNKAVYVNETDRVINLPAGKRVMKNGSVVTLAKDTEISVKGKKRVGGSSLRDFHAVAADQMGIKAKQARKTVTKNFDALTETVGTDPRTGRFFGTSSESLSGLDGMVRSMSGRMAGSQSIKAFKANKEAGEAFNRAKTLKGLKATGANLKGLVKSVKVAVHTVGAKTGTLLYKNPQGRFFDVAGASKYIPESVGGALSVKSALGVAAIGYGASRLYHYGMPKDDPYGTKKYNRPWDNPRDWSNRPYFEGGIANNLGPRAKSGKRKVR